MIIAKEFLTLKGDMCLYLVFLKTHSNSLGRACSFDSLHAERLQKLTLSQLLFNILLLWLIYENLVRNTYELKTGAFFLFNCLFL